MRRSIGVLAFVLAFASSAQAAPGDPRLVQGVLEWPAKLTVEPFVVVRSEDGRWYYAEVKDAKRLGPGPLAAGARVTILGTEAARPHEITALAFGSGDAAALALALMPHAAPIPATSSAPTTEAPRTSTQSVPAPVAKSRTEPTPTPSPATPTPPAQAPVAEPQMEKAIAPATPASPTRWAEVRGTVHSVAEQKLVVRTEDGQLVPVDLSSLRGAAVSLTAGSPIVVYGTLGDEKFRAIGLIQHEARPSAKPAPAPQQR